MEVFAKRLEDLCDHAQANWDWMSKNNNDPGRAYSAMVMQMSTISQMRIVIEDMREAEKAKIIDLTELEE